MKPLTPRQEHFVLEYVKDYNATQAAIRAGYSEKTAGSQGQRLLTNVEIQHGVVEAMAGRTERVRIDGDWLLSRLGEEATADIADLYDDDGNLLPVKQWPLIWRQGLVAGVDTEEIMVKGVKMSTVKKIKISDRIKRFEMIGKHVDIQAFKEQVEHKGGISLTVNKDDAEL